MKQRVTEALEQVRVNLLSRNCDVRLLEITRLGVVTVSLSGDCCKGRLRKLLTIIDIENAVKKQVPEVRVVIEGEGAHEKGELSV